MNDQKTLHSVSQEKEENLHPTPSVCTEMNPAKMVTHSKYHMTKKPEQT